ncbi:MAG: hypothetical protein JRH20_32720, partial [Deltaproteobacteria bacterium]|nr:hypothetical protein [Deltaproteobacteria bacterium]
MSELRSPSADGRGLEPAAGSIARRVARQRSSGEPIAIRDRPQDSRMLQVLGVTYMVLKTEQGGDLYLTTAGSQFLQQLLPENWYESDWFRAHRERLVGTAAVYRSTTKPHAGASLEIVVKFNRVGQDIPPAGDEFEEALYWEFNGPFEEFSLLQELRHAGPADVAIETQVPLAIYIPPERVQPWRSGRSEWRMARKVEQHPGVALDILRRYVMVYQWLPGIDAWE